MLGFDSYVDMSSHLHRRSSDGHEPASHVPSDRRTLLPLSPAARQQGAGSVALPGHGGATLDAPARRRDGVLEPGAES